MESIKRPLFFALLLVAACQDLGNGKEEGSISMQDEPTDTDVNRSWDPDHDGDGDGYPNESDCDDSDAAVNPGVAESCDGQDTNCDGRIDEVCYTRPKGFLGPETADATLLGRQPSGGAGEAVAAAGDVDADGRPDLLVGAPYEDLPWESAGSAYLVTSPVRGVVQLSEVAVATILGTETREFAGRQICGAGDVDADGFDDLLFGSNQGVVLLRGPKSGSVSLTDADAVFEDQHGTRIGGSGMAGAKDVDGDGLADILIGRTTDRHGDVNDSLDGGSVYLYTEPPTEPENNYSPTAHLLGYVYGGRLGTSVAATGDLNGDGLADIVMGAPGWPGRTFILWGPIIGTHAISARADATLKGEDKSAYAGYSVSGAGDVNGDGLPDLLVGAPRNSTGGVYAGAAYLVTDRVEGELSLSLATAKLVGENAEDQAGGVVSDAGDVDGDGLADVLVGGRVNQVDGYDAAAAHLLYGPLAGVIDLSEADAKFVGEAGMYANVSLAGLGDINNDSYDDFVIGVSYHGSELGHPGAAFLFYGGP